MIDGDREFGYTLTCDRCGECCDETFETFGNAVEYKKDHSNNWHSKRMSQANGRIFARTAGSICRREKIQMHREHENMHDIREYTEEEQQHFTEKGRVLYDYAKAGCIKQCRILIVYGCRKGCENISTAWAAWCEALLPFFTGIFWIPLLSIAWLLSLFINIIRAPFIHEAVKNQIIDKYFERSKQDE